jgi:hypothetical protein
MRGRPCTRFRSVDGLGFLFHDELTFFDELFEQFPPRQVVIGEAQIRKKRLVGPRGRFSNFSTNWLDKGLLRLQPFNISVIHRLYPKRVLLGLPKPK